MAKKKDDQEPAAEAAEVKAEGAGPEAAPAEAADPRDSEIARLRRQLAELTAKANGGLSSEAGRPRRFRVKLPGVKPRVPTFTVSAREGAPEKCREKPEAAYSHEDLAPHEPESPAHKGDYQGAAWLRYAAEHGLDAAKDRAHFRVQPSSGAPQEHLDVVGISPADAFENFKRVNGILATQAVPVVEPAPEPEAAASPA